MEKGADSIFLKRPVTLLVYILIRERAVTRPPIKPRLLISGFASLRETVKYSTEPPRTFPAPCVFAQFRRTTLATQRFNLLAGAARSPLRPAALIIQPPGTFAAFDRRQRACLRAIFETAGARKVQKWIFARFAGRSFEKAPRPAFTPRRR